ncbi:MULTISPECIES: hypothetical protein [Bacilli]|uniref:Phage protein n=2 Tax=Staphylococcus haemolyticus TaxID=1283 RepID=A0ABU3IDB4_STAHA|nr:MULTISPECIES: hypothetical protein [Bacilli]MBE9438594.1 hypothetical protein [Enterococcus faecalis]MBW3856411.1 hypothetical protein [Staphylococcus haemolyticus]MCH4373992.1 hypothetical protein [Staphylococcus haemolyticus]MCH4503472.1 hypothetical protein [Staphylococcus haemolyticus]MCH4510585.1 hypothetical protein [Staphylococcus haemolyticus]
MMQTPLTQDYILETEEGRYYKDTVSIYAGNKVTHKVLETTTDVYKAERFSDRDVAYELSKAYNFKVLALNTYLEEVN